MEVVSVKPENISSITWSKTKGWSVLLADSIAFCVDHAAVGSEEVYCLTKAVPESSLCEIVDTSAD